MLKDHPQETHKIPKGGREVLKELCSEGLTCDVPCAAGAAAPSATDDCSDPQ